MSTRLQIILISIIALMAGLGFVATHLLFQGQEEIARQQSQILELKKLSVAQVESVKDQEEQQPAVVPTEVTTEPELQKFSLGDTTFFVEHWNFSSSDAHAREKEMIHVWLEDGAHKTKEVFTDFNEFPCGVPYEYGVNGTYFYLKRQEDQPCGSDGGKEDMYYFWFEKDGDLIASYHNIIDTDDSEHKAFYHLKDGYDKQIKLVLNKSCKSFPKSSFLPSEAGEAITPKVELVGIDLEGKRLELNPSKTMTCPFNEVLGLPFDQDFYVSSTGPQVELEIPYANTTFLFDIRNPEQFSSKSWK